MKSNEPRAFRFLDKLPRTVHADGSRTVHIPMPTGARSVVGDIYNQEPVVPEYAAASITDIPLGQYAGANRYDTDDEHVLHLWAAVPEPMSYDIRIPKRDVVDRAAAFAALADLDAHDTPLLCAHHLGTEWVRWDDVRDLIRSTLNPEAGAPAATTGDDTASLPVSAPASVTTPAEPTWLRAAITAYGMGRDDEAAGLAEPTLSGFAARVARAAPEAVPYPEVLRRLGIDPDAPTLVALTSAIDPSLDGTYAVARVDDGSFTLTPAAEDAP